MPRKKIITKEYSYTVIYESVKQGGYQVTIPLLPGLITYGRTFEEARKMAREAALCYIGASLKKKEEVPEETGILQERVTVTV